MWTSFWDGPFHPHSTLWWFPSWTVNFQNSHPPSAHIPLSSHPTAFCCVFAFSPLLISQYTQCGCEPLLHWRLKLLLPRLSLISRSPMPFSFNSWNAFFLYNYFICCLLAYLVSLPVFKRNCYSHLLKKGFFCCWMNCSVNVKN